MSINMKSFLCTLTLLVFGVVGCMNQAKNGNTSGVSRNLFNDQTSGILNGQVPGAGGSGSGGSLTPQDTQALQTVVKDPLINPVLTPQDKQAGIDDAISESLKKEAEALKAKAQAAKNEQQRYEVYLAKTALMQKIITECTVKAQKLVPLPGDPVIGKWVKASGDCAVNPFVVAAGSKQISGISGGITGQLAAYVDGRIEISSQSLRGSGKDSGYRGNEQASGTASLTGQRVINSKGGPRTVACSANVVLDQPQNQMPEKHDKAMALLGSCYQRGVAILGLQSIFTKMDPRLSEVLFQQMLRAE